MRISDWSSDVCSSDLLCRHFELFARIDAQGRRDPRRLQSAAPHPPAELSDAQPLDRGRLARHARRSRHRLHRLFAARARSEKHTSELQSLMRISYAVFCLNKKKTKKHIHTSYTVH